jgi:hypothetical protein
MAKLEEQGGLFRHEDFASYKMKSRRRYQSTIAVAFTRTLRIQGDGSFALNILP